MVKQKMVIKLSLGGGDKKKRKEALKTAVGLEGVIAVKIGDDNRLVVIGEGTDVIELTTLLRKKLGFADVISVTTAENNSSEEDYGTNLRGPQRDSYYRPYGHGVPAPYGYSTYPSFNRCLEY